MMFTVIDMVNVDNDALHSSIHRSLVDLSSSSSQAVCVRVFAGVALGRILSESSLLLLVSSTLPTLALTYREKLFKNKG